MKTFTNFTDLRQVNIFVKRAVQALKRLKKQKKKNNNRGFGFATVFDCTEFVSTKLIELNGVERYGKPILIEEARSQPTQSLNFDPRLRNTQNPQNLPPSKEQQKDLPSIPPKQKTCDNYSDAFKPRKKSIVFFSDSIPKNLKMKDFNAAVRGGRVHPKSFLVRKQYNSSVM